MHINDNFIPKRSRCIIRLSIRTDKFSQIVISNNDDKKKKEEKHADVVVVAPVVLFGYVSICTVLSVYAVTVSQIVRAENLITCEKDPV